MDENKLQEIKKAEAEAADLLEKARVEASQIVSSAGEKAVDLFEEEKAKIKKEAHEMIRKMKEEGTAQAEKEISALDSALSEVEKSAKGNLSKAVDFVIREMKGRYVNS